MILLHHCSFKSLSNHPCGVSHPALPEMLRPNQQPMLDRAGQRRKIVLQPGHSALDWENKRQSGEDLRGGIPGFLKVTKEELAKHNTEEDAWTVLSGRVYNITPYINFHPGGDKEIMRCAGRDGTRLFMLIHSWVNYEHMLDKCLVGMYVG